MSRIEKAVEVLRAGGYFRKALETDRYTGREQFQMRLRDARGLAVKGIGFQTFFAMQADGRLEYRHPHDARSSIWPEEYVLRAEARAA